MKGILTVITCLGAIAKLILMIYSGWRFFTGKPDDNATLWCGILFLATLI